MAAILVVDDDSFGARLMSIRIEQAGHTTMVVGSGRAALQTLHEHVPDLIVLDLLMPGLSGAQLAKQLREDPRTASIPILMVTASGGPRIQEVTAASNVDVVMSKPLDFTQFCQQINVLLASVPHM
jgi:CheY-like chemotaxis protein